jgi:hypothetical protein
MDKIATYKIIPELKLIIEVFAGKISIIDAIELKRREIEDKDYNLNYNFIVSINELETDDKFEYDFSRYIDTIKEDNRIRGIRKSAIITKTPNQVVAGTLYEFAARELPMNFRIVSTIKAALNWINLSNDFESTITENIELLIKTQPEIGS